MLEDLEAFGEFDRPIDGLGDCTGNLVEDFDDDELLVNKAGEGFV